MSFVQSCPRQLSKTIVGTTLAAVVGLTVPAVGQFGEALGFADSMQPDLFSRDLVVFSEVLELDESQRLIVDSLFTDHQEAFQLGLQNMRHRFDEMRDQLQAVERAWADNPEIIGRINALILVRLPVLYGRLNDDRMRPDPGDYLEVPTRRGG